MKMEVEDRLTGMGTGIRHDSVSGLGNPLHRRHMCADPHEMSDEGGIPVRGLLHGWNMLLRYDEDVHGRLRMDILKRDGMLVFMQDCRRNRAVRDFTEQTVAHGLSP